MELEKTIALLLAGTALVTSPVFAQEVGTAAAVNPESQSTPAGGSTTTLKVGARVVHKERIKTTPQGSVQLLFLDRSTLSIAPNSEIVIDEFVYNPGAGSGHMAVSLAKGALRFVGGQLSHAGQTTVNTPGATIGIRGGYLHRYPHGGHQHQRAAHAGEQLPAGEAFRLEDHAAVRPDHAGYRGRACLFHLAVRRQVRGERRGAGPDQRTAQRSGHRPPLVSSASRHHAAERDRS
jgi:hypothetical protein